MLATEVGTALSCIEAEALAKLLSALGAPSAAELWIEEHTPSDQPGDAHFRGSPPH